MSYSDLLGESFHLQAHHAAHEFLHADPVPRYGFCPAVKKLRFHDGPFSKDIEQNGFQTAAYYEEYKAGNVLPIVGSTDSHGSTEHNRNGDICSTIVFAHANERADIIASIKDKYSVAVDTISKEYRLVGEFRYQKYASFLMENWYPVHDRLAAADGEIMREYYVGDACACELAVMKKKSDAMFAKYFKTTK
jgi:hypothetical protein